MILNKPGQKVILLGNEAIVRGALESGVQFISTYPGTPTSEIGNIFYKISKGKSQNFYFEFSTNEKVALEAAIGASFSGLKTLVAMKGFGLNVCSDSLLPFAYTGNKGATVIVVGDDPSCWSSAQSEQDSRAYSYLTHLPTLEPSDPQECKDFTKLGFKISEKFKIPVIIRTTTRVNHQSMPVRLEKLQEKGNKFLTGKFVKNPKEFVTMPPRVLEMKKRLLGKIKKIKNFSENSPLNKFYRGRASANSKLGIVTSGISYLHVMEALKELNLNLPVFKLGFFYPLAEEKIKNFIKNLEKILVVEELEPYLEKEIKRLAKDVNPSLQIFGKNLLPQFGELKPETVALAISKITNKEFSVPKFIFKGLKHLPRFCSGCPYWQVFSVVKKVAPKNTVFGGDIGCYMMAGLSPHFLQDYLSSMGSSIGIAHGISKSNIEQKVIAFIGDSTFFHAGIPALINTVFNKSNPLIIILDNGTTAMTGHQPYPGSAVRIDSEYKYEWEGYLPSLETPEKPIKIEDIVLACGVKNLKIVDSFKIQEIEKAIKEFLPKKEVSVIIARGMCALLAKSLK
jgi:indolepyruvate ferredoxin oxidoreductase alpha subunit